jgi:hypothetical protein
LSDLKANIQENLEDEFVQDALNRGLDLRQYSKDVERDLGALEKSSIKDCKLPADLIYLEISFHNKLTFDFKDYKEALNIIQLHGKIKSCDKILETIESMLDGFQKNLCSISSEIQQLQQQSVTMNIKLRNRQSVRGELSQFIDEMLVPESMIK